MPKKQTRKPSTLFASCAVLLPTPGELAPRDVGYNVQLLPVGKFRAPDGRPGSITSGQVEDWLLDLEAADLILAAWKANGSRLVVDYEHQSLNSQDNGQPAPAAGWMEDLVFDTERGLYARVAWTERARTMIEAGEYRYISPVFTFDVATGRVQALHSAALTNTPALPQLDPVQLRRAESSQPTQEDFIMNELLQAALDALGIEADQATPQAITDAIAALKAAKEPDPAQYVTIEEYNALVAQLRRQGREAETTERQRLVEEALRDGRLLPPQKAWAEKLPLAQLREYLDAATPLAALKTSQGARQAGEPDEPIGEGVNVVSLKKAAQSLGLIAA